MRHLEDVKKEIDAMVLYLQHGITSNLQFGELNGVSALYITLTYKYNE